MSSLKRKAGNLPAAGAKKLKQQGSLMSFLVPKDGKVEAPAAAPDFDKEKWLAKLTDEQKRLLKLEIDTLDDSWLVHLKDEITTPEFLELKRFLELEERAGKTVFPPKKDIYSWSRHTPFHKVKVFILGQDPYHNHNQAHGLAFSVNPPTPAPPSLRNMYICLRNDYPSFVAPPKNGGLLTPWAERGVLMLNTCLTVRAHEANSHAKKGWERFTQKVLDCVAARKGLRGGVVFMAWGKPAGDRVARVDGKRHLVLKSVHPSPLSASKGFFTCGHFKLANEWLVQRYGEGADIEWSLAEGTSTKTVVGTEKKSEDDEGTKEEAVKPEE